MIARTCPTCGHTSHPPRDPNADADRAARIRAYRAQVESDIEAARNAGQAWTEFRPFVNQEERVGAMRCGSTGHRARKCRDSAYVSYLGVNACVVLCEDCYKRRNQ